MACVPDMRAGADDGHLREGGERVAGERFAIGRQGHDDVGVVVAMRDLFADRRTQALEHGVEIEFQGAAKGEFQIARGLAAVDGKSRRVRAAIAER
jgi:hypothetical protein